MFYEMVRIGKIAMDSFLVKNVIEKGISLRVFESLPCSLFDMARIFNSKKNLLEKIIYDRNYHRKNVTFIPVIPVFNQKDG